MTINFATPIRKALEELHQVKVLRLKAQYYGLAVFPERDKTEVSHLLVLGDWHEWWMPEHWMRSHGLGVGAFINAECADLQLMSMQAASNCVFENRFEEALADPKWVATHAEHARSEMLTEVESAAFLMEIAWQKAQNIPVTRPTDRWQEASIFGLGR